MKSDMSLCEERRLVDNEYVWVKVNAKDLPSGKNANLRCRYCKGMIRIHKKRSENGPRDHAEHLLREDSEKCPGGFYFNKDK